MANHFYLDTHNCEVCRQAFQKMIETSDDNDTFYMPDAESDALKKHLREVHPEMQSS